MTLAAHLSTGCTTVARCWAVTRKDGVTLGFTDHDRTLVFDGIEFRADTGMTAKALASSTSLSVDNGEAMGALSDPAITEADIAAGRYDDAEVRAWLVNWRDIAEREVQFRGTLGEIARSGGAFRAELRGLAEPLNAPRGRVYQSRCPAVLGDAQCGFDTATPGFSIVATVTDVVENRQLSFADPGGLAETWFQSGTLIVLSGAAKGLSGLIRTDDLDGTVRRIGLVEAFGPSIAPGDDVQLEAGCDKRSETCRAKFNNFNNFRGFPHIPGEDWLMAYPKEGGRNDGGSMQ